MVNTRNTRNELKVCSENRARTATVLTPTVKGKTVYTITHRLKPKCFFNERTKLILQFAINSRPFTDFTKTWNEATVSVTQQLFSLRMQLFLTAS